ncbi:AAA family ATPase [Pseudoalteromonas sp. 2CM32C]|uniref:AAA family ATPase n=1 Tax=Pseudoalteromonas sp. 2CM32C TaxID=2929852 RepID=UPI0020BFD2F4|nr:AAA family ATPase [Pseudoalteromonas sp. 2CM32C]MCK8120930.1 ATP-dependent RecD-like DNA helicase [Pseudoalteromonas sp. 2CM32C]
MNTEFFRVTSIRFDNAKHVIFMGIPLKKNSYKMNSGKYTVSVKAFPDSLPVNPAIGQHWEVKGVKTLSEYENNGYVMKQHVFDSPIEVKCSLPESGEQLINFIANEKDFIGIGESKARKLWNALGSDFHQLAKKDTTESRSRFSGLLSEVSINALYKGYAKYTNLSACNWMSEQNIPFSIQQRLLKYHNENSITAIKDNPYLLIGFGMSFENADRLAINILDREEDEPKRLSAALEVAIRKQIELGHTFTKQNELKPKLMAILNNQELCSKALKAGHNKAQYILNPKLGTYHPTAQLLMENVVAKRLIKLASQNNLRDEYTNSAYCFAVNQLPYALTKKQIEAITTCLDNAVSCITGGAGTGKTTVLRTALRAYHKLGYEIHAVALSGRAAMRLHESIGFLTSTIAKLFREAPIEPSDEQPKHLLVIDEASMIDLPTMYRLVNHVHPTVHIIFTGDPDQLPPIGCGKILADIVLSQSIANTMLDIVKRQDGSTGIPEYSKYINQGIVPENLSFGAVHFHETPKQHIANVCCELYLESSYNSRVMAPTKKLVQDINNQIQDTVNEHGEQLKFNLQGDEFYVKLRVNDQILFTQNLYDKGVNNGSLGELSSVTNAGDCFGEVTLDTGDKVEITQPVLDCMELGYAITLHKAQGSQFPRVIIALQQGRIVDRAWLYTAITRAESEIHLVGSATDFKLITKSPSNSNSRNSFLCEILRDQGN